MGCGVSLVVTLDSEVTPVIHIRAQSVSFVPSEYPVRGVFYAFAFHCRTRVEMIVVFWITHFQ